MFNCTMSHIPHTPLIGYTRLVRLHNFLKRPSCNLKDLYNFLACIVGLWYLYIINIPELIFIYCKYFYELKMKDVARKVFRKGEQAFFQALGHVLSSNTLMLDQCPSWYTCSDVSMSALQSFDPERA